MNRNRTMKRNAKMTGTRQRALWLLLLLAGVAVGIGELSAHGGDDHDHGGAATATPAAAGSELAIAKEQQFALEMVTEPVMARELARNVEATGRVMPRTEAIADVMAPIAGRVSEGQLRRLGDRVRKGEVLFRVEQVLAPSERTALRTEQAKARAELQTAEQEVSRLERLEGVVAGKQIVEARIRRDASRDAYEAITAQLGGQAGSVPVTAPIAGVIIEAEIASGEVLDGSRVVYRIADLSKVWVEADLFEGDIARVEGAQSAEIRTPSYPGETFTGTLYRMGSLVDPSARTIRALFLVDNPQERLKLNMSAAISVNVASAGSVTAVPRDAIVRSGARSVVFVHTAPERFAIRDVITGAGATGPYVEILRGLEPGERVLITGTHQARTVAGL